MAMKMSTSTVCKVDDVDFHIVGAVRLLESVSSCVPVSVRLCMCLPVSLCLCLCVCASVFLCLFVYVCVYVCICLEKNAH